MTDKKEEERADREVQDEIQRERARLLGMAFGTRAYNDAMGYGGSSREPCGHHCPSDCPRCST